jgi:hypothetical protein
MRGAIPPFSLYVFIAWCSFKAQGQIYLLILRLLLVTRNYAKGWKIGVPFPARTMMGYITLTSASRSVLEPTQPPIQRVQGSLTLSVKPLGGEVNHSAPYS